MALLTPELREQIAKVGIIHLATASKAGVPNAVPMGAVFPKDEEDTICIANNYMNKTLANIKENPQVSLLVWSRDIGNCFQLKGTAEIVKGDEDHKRIKALLDAKKPGAFPCKELVVIHIKEIYTCKPGPDAGKKIA
ncbi:MAG TPA: pyridoxamine 5'-phosphate oxidase family protein [Methanocorpusculum sp.]|nr:pyridoxamine 5'-phosphate oxidase family protein [Methanocorpusculum sp.]